MGKIGKKLKDLNPCVLRLSAAIKRLTHICGKRMILGMETPETLQAAVAYFSNPDRAFEAAVRYRWPDGNVICPRCGQAKHSFVKTRKLWFCYACKKQFTVKVGTIMEDSPLGYDKWMIAFWMLANCKNGVSSYELGRTLGIRQNTAWFMLQRIREVMAGKKFGNMTKLGGANNEVEVDEAYVGAKAKNSAAGTGEEEPF